MAWALFPRLSLVVGIAMTVAWWAFSWSLGALPEWIPFAVSLPFSLIGMWLPFVGLGWVLVRLGVARPVPRVLIASAPSLGVLAALVLFAGSLGNEEELGDLVAATVLILGATVAAVALAVQGGAWASRTRRQSHGAPPAEDAAYLDEHDPAG